MSAPLTRADLLTWPATVNVPTGGRAFGIGRQTAYARARTGELAPGVPVLRLGNQLRVPTAAILRALGIAADEAST